VAHGFDLALLKRGLNRQEPLPLPEKELPIASVAIIIDPENRGGSVLLIQRIERSGDPWSGQIGFPGGHMSPSDRGFLQTAIREAEEEVGIDLSQQELLGSMPFVTTLSRRVQVAPFVFALRSPVTVRPNREVADSFWVSLAELMRLDVERTIVHLEEGKVEADCFNYHGRIIWGLTLRILNLLLGRRADYR